LKNDHAVYEQLFGLFKDDLSFQSRMEFLSIEAQDSRAFLRVPFWSWQKQQKEVSSILHKNRFDEGLQFNFPLLSDVLPLCQCVIGGGELEISPRCLPIDVIPSFGKARRRIYMTATLADDGILITHFNAGADAVSDPIRPKGAGDIGDRLILAPQEITPTITKEEVKKLLVDIGRKKNVVVIVPSFRAADFWKDAAQLTLHRGNLADGVKQLKKGHVGLSVLVNKYDGIDLPDDACRVLVIDGLPEVYGLTERSEMLTLEGTALELARQVQRIEQGMGRGVRSSEDYCVVLLLGAKLTKRVHLPGAREKFNPATLAQIDLGKAVSDQVRGKPLKDLRPIIDLCLTQDTQWLNASRNALVSAEEGAKSHVDPNAVLNRTAFDQARSADYPGAAATIQKTVAASSELATRGYQKQLTAEYLNFFDQPRAQETLKSAIKDNPRVLKPIVGITYSKLSTPTATQAKNVVENLKRFATPNDLTLHINSILEDLAWNEDETKAFEAALAEAGLLLGFGSQRPELESKEGPDNLWALGSLKYLVIECKSGATTATISKSDSDQLSGALNWFKEHYDQSCGATPILIHPSHVFDSKASPHETVRVVDKEHLEKFRVALRQYIHAIASGDNLDNASLIGDQLKYHALTGGAVVDRYSRRFLKK
jgi:hypothetical protein